MKKSTFKINGVIKYIEQKNNIFCYYIATKNQVIPCFCYEQIKGNVGDKVMCNGEIQQKLFYKKDGCVNYSSKYILKNIEKQTVNYSRVIHSIVLQRVLQLENNTYLVIEHNGLETLFPFELHCDLKDGYYERLNILRKTKVETISGVILNEYKVDTIISAIKKSVSQSQIRYWQDVLENLSNSHWQINTKVLQYII